MLGKIFNSKTNNFTFAAFLIALSTFLSGALGLMRDRLLAGSFGAGRTLDIYFAAFRIPDFLQAVLVAGGIGATFLPVFSKEFERGKEKAFKFANNILNCSLFALLIISLVLFLFTPQVLKFITPGFTQQEILKTAFLTRIMFLSPIFFCLSAILSGVLQYFDRFLVYSLAPILYNLGIILGIVLFVPIFGTYGLAIGVIFGAFLHFLIQVPAAKNVGFYYSKIFNPKDEALLKITKLTIPSAIGSGFSQINLIVITALASTLIPGSIAIFNFSKNLQYFPVGMIGVPFAISAFPALSRSWAGKQKEKFWEYFSLAFRQILFLTIPISFLVFLLRAQIVRIVLGAGLWGWLETRLTAACLGIFALSIFSSSLNPLFQRGFYSIHDTKTPTIIQILDVFMNVGFAILFLKLLGFSNPISNFLSNFLKLRDIKNIQIIAFPLAMGICDILQAIALFYIFVRKIDSFSLFGIFKFLKNILILTFFMSIGVRFILKPLAGIFALSTFWGVFFQTIFASLFGALIYLLGAFLLKSPELKNLTNSILKRES